MENVKSETQESTDGVSCEQWSWRENKAVHRVPEHLFFLLEIFYYENALAF